MPWRFKKKIMVNYYKQFYANSLKNTEEMDRILDTNNLPKLRQKNVENLNSSITKVDIESIIKILPSKKVQMCSFMTSTTLLKN